jgi:hypothetical protein|tara:strand:- start:859 stop:1155 length:297 start_codon:yes stop_codon:yes gene_type:complete
MLGAGYLLIYKSIIMTSYQEDSKKPLTISSAKGTNLTSRGYYNLCLSIRDVSLFIHGIQPNRHWRLKHVKSYFGLSGGKEKILQQLKGIQALHMITKP